MSAPPWRSVEELTRVGFERSRVVMANEAHSGLSYCPRTRRVGTRMVRAAHELGVRRLAMEALPNSLTGGPLPDPLPDEGYLGQPEMRELVGTALGLGWTLHPYEIVVDWANRPPGEGMSMEFTNRRELAQAQNLAALADGGGPLLVWCGNAHAAKDRSDEWTPMGWHFPRVSGVEAFAIDQCLTVNWPEDGPVRPDLTRDLADVLAAFGGTAGILREDIGAEHDPGRAYDAYVASLDNDFV